MKGKIVAKWLALHLVKRRLKTSDRTPGTAVFHDFVKSSLLSNTYIWNLKNDTDEPVCRKGMDTQM